MSSPNLARSPDLLSLLLSSSDLARTKVIDMTGREQRVLSGYHAIHGQRAPPEVTADDETRTAFDMPELLHNINLMVDICEQVTDGVVLGREVLWKTGEGRGRGER